MSVKVTQPRAGEPPLTVVEPAHRLLDLDLRALWQYRELLYFLIWRDVKVRYKQTAIGFTWVIIQPVVTMVIFTVIFGNFANIPSDGLPYPIFSFTALLPWSYFAQALGQSGRSLVGNAGLISKVYFPRLVIPLVAVSSPLVDFAVSFLVLLGMMVWFSVTPTWGVLLLPVFLLLAALTAFAVGLWLSALNVRYRDVSQLMPFLVQVWMYASPVIYPVSTIPEKWRLLYSLNPMVGVIEGFRWALLGKSSPDFTVMAVGSAIVLLLLAGGLVYFKRVESSFADVI